MNNEMYTRIIGCVEKAMEKPCGEINMDSRLQEDLGMTSLDLVMLQIALEEEFLIVFDPINDDFGEIFKSISSVYGFVKEQLT